MLRRLELPSTICACGSALAAGDLGAPPGGPAAASPAAALLPMFAAGDRSGGHRAWLADVLAALLLSAQVRLDYVAFRTWVHSEGRAALPAWGLFTLALKPGSRAGHSRV